jgi:hypothetical protein
MWDADDGRHRSAIVWSVDAADAPGYMKLSPRGYAAELEKAMGGILGAVEIAVLSDHVFLVCQQIFDAHTRSILCEDFFVDPF